MEFLYLYAPHYYCIDSVDFVTSSSDDRLFNMVKRNVKINNNNKKKLLRRELKSSKKKKGDGIIDKIIDHMPIEMHIPGYQFCGPGNSYSFETIRYFCEQFNYNLMVQ